MHNPSVYDKIRRFNAVFGLPAPLTIDSNVDRQALAARIHDQFMEMLVKEFAEGGDVLIKMRDERVPLADAMTELADWLGDIQVYCASEMVRHGIPIESVMHAIMDSQDSKLVDGKPLVDNGKVVKGTGYVAPEPRIREIIKRVIR